MADKMAAALSLDILKNLSRKQTVRIIADMKYE
jgi:hypothetical protein